MGFPKVIWDKESGIYQLVLQPVVNDAGKQQQERKVCVQCGVDAQPPSSDDPLVLAGQISGDPRILVSIQHRPFIKKC